MSEADSVDVIYRNEEGHPVIATGAACNGCGTTEFPEGNVNRPTQDNPSKVHVCAECGTLSATEVPRWRRLGESDVYIAPTTEGVVCRDDSTGEYGGPVDDKFDCLAEIGYETEDDVKALFD